MNYRHLGFQHVLNNVIDTRIDKIKDFTKSLRTLKILQQSNVYYVYNSPINS